ncbi:transposase [Gemmatimonas sp.]|uniref:transposase n=1 Tax=Gemmatimonas sp. TaxID=1962908 RepID=UPI003566CB33
MASLNRLELSGATVADRERNKKITVDHDAVDRRFVHAFVQAHTTAPTAPTEIVLDLDATDDPVHGAQEGRFFHDDDGLSCDPPRYFFAGEHRRAHPRHGAQRMAGSSEWLSVCDALRAGTRDAAPMSDAMVTVRGINATSHANPPAGPRRNPVSSIPPANPARRRSASAATARSRPRDGQNTRHFHRTKTSTHSRAPKPADLEHS